MLKFRSKVIMLTYVVKQQIKRQICETKQNNKLMNEEMRKKFTLNAQCDIYVTFQIPDTTGGYLKETSRNVLYVVCVMPPIIFHSWENRSRFLWVKSDVFLTKQTLFVIVFLCFSDSSSD